MRWRRNRNRRDVAIRTGVAASISTSAAAVDILTGIPAGTLLAPIIAPGVDDVLSRALSSRQRQRVNDLITYAADSFRKMCEEEGARLRDDDFFQDRDGRWSSQEVVEAALIAASNEPQELKLRYLGHLLASLAVEKDIDVPSAHWVLEQARALTWLQYVQLAIIGDSESHDLPDAEIRSTGANWDEFNATDQLSDLGYWRRGMIGPPSDGTQSSQAKWPDTNLSNQCLRHSGLLLHHLLGLKSLPRIIQTEHVALLARALTQEATAADTQSR